MGRFKESCNQLQIPKIKRKSCDYSAIENMQWSQLTFLPLVREREGGGGK